MRIALVGYGKMGKEVEKVILNTSHSVSFLIDVHNVEDLLQISKENTDAIIEFSTPESVVQNLKKLLPSQVPIVCGTTGWYHYISEIQELTNHYHSTLIYASNFSIGVNILFLLNEYLAKMMNQFADYDVFVEERHHNQKKDAPGGTALTLANSILDKLQRKKSIAQNLEHKAPLDTELSVSYTRSGKIVGTHIVGYQSETDMITIQHEAYRRDGFAKGAVLAAEWALEIKGFWDFRQLLVSKMT